MRYLLVIAVFMLTATTPLFAQMGEEAPEAPEEEPGESPPEEAEKLNPWQQQAKRLTTLFSGVDELLKDNKVTQVTIDAFIKHAASMKKASDGDKTFKELKNESTLKAYNHVIKQDWFKKWGTDNSIESPNQWLKDFLTLKFSELQMKNVPELKKEMAMKTKKLAALKEAADEKNVEIIKNLEAEVSGYEDIIKACELVPQLSDAEVKLIEKNAKAIKEADGKVAPEGPKKEAAKPEEEDVESEGDMD